MDENIKVLLDKININDDYRSYFEDAKMTKVKVTKDLNNWKIYIKKETLLPKEVLEELEEKKHLLDENVKK